MNLPRHAYWLAAVHSPGINPRKILRWLEHFADITALFQAPPEKWQEIGLSVQDRAALSQPNWQAVEKDLNWAQLPGHSIIALEDDAYPSLLREISNPPLILYVRGEKTILKQRQLAMVGSRKASSNGRKTAQEFAHALAKANWIVTSGLALGIDQAAHRGALSAQGLTIGVAGTGLDHIYPPSHQHLYQEIIEQGGAILSEFPLSTPPYAGNFPRRNRIISGLSRGVLLVEAALRSGSLVTARHALEQDREVFAIPGSIYHPLSRGCHALIRQGAKLVETLSDILEELDGLKYDPHTTAPPSALPLPDLAPASRHILETIDSEVTPLDVILSRSAGLTAATVSAILLDLELKDYIQSTQGGYIRTDR